MSDSALEILEAKQTIRDLVTRYCWGVDGGDLDLVRSVYHPDAIEHHHAAFDGTIDEYIGWLAAVLPGFDGMMHFVGTHSSEVVGDGAMAETYAFGVHWGGSIDDERNFTSGVKYVDYLERRDGRWGIAERWAVRVWLRSDAGHRRPISNPDSWARPGNDPMTVATSLLYGVHQGKGPLA